MVLIIKVAGKICLCLVLAFSVIFLCGASGEKLPGISAQSAVLVHNGQIIYDKNADCRLPMASTTKIMTAIVTIENAMLDDMVEIEAEHCNVEGSSMYLKPGTQKTVHELLMGLLLVSGNDAALALSDHVAGNVEKFTDLMNSKAKAIGLANTNFKNPHGLNHSSHYTTAYDLALLMEYCMDNEVFRDIISMKSFESDGAQLLNHNKLLFSCPGCTGGKTGYTLASGRCLVSCCEREGARVICVTLSAPDDWNDHMALYDWVYANYSMRSVTDNVHFSTPLISDSVNMAQLVPESEREIFARDNAEIKLESEMPWFTFKPVHKGSKGGKVSFFVDGNKLGEYYLIYSEDLI